MTKQRLIPFLLLLLLSVVGCKGDQVVVPPSPPQPRISSITPNSLAIGDQDVSVQIIGSNFSSIQTVSLGTGVRILRMNVPDQSHINLTVEVPKTAIPGPRTVTVSAATGSAQLVDALQIEDNNLKPRAIFQVEPKSGSQLTEFLFDASESEDTDGRIKSYYWDFSDSFSKKAVVKHKFSEAGDITVRLTVKDDFNAEDTATKTIHVWDAVEAMKEIDEVCKQFLILFGQIETLSAERIVVGFSTDPQCPGRQREIDIINTHKPNVGTTFVQILGDTVITELTEDRAKAYLTARFYGTQKDGTSFDGVATHFFTLVHEEAGWKICDFTVDSTSITVNDMLNL